MIIDDDPNGIQAITNLVTQFEFPVNIIGSATTLADGIPLLNKYTPDLLFLDIEMKNESGFDLLEIWEPNDTKVIFCTGYDQYAIKALKKGAYDYILKPLDYKEFMALFKKLDTESKESFSNSAQENTADSKNRLTIKSPGGIFIIDFCEINYLKADGRYTSIHYGDHKECTSSKNLGQFEEELEFANFERVSKSLIINKDRLKGVEKKGANSYILFKGEELEISDGIRKSLIKMLD